MQLAAAIRKVASGIVAPTHVLFFGGLANVSTSVSLLPTDPDVRTVATNAAAPNVLDNIPPHIHIVGPGIQISVIPFPMANAASIRLLWSHLMICGVALSLSVLRIANNSALGFVCCNQTWQGHMQCLL